MAANPNIIQYGISNVHYAVRNDDGTYATPVHMPGGESMGMSNSGSSNFTVWADNGKYWDRAKSSGKEGDLQMAKFLASYYADVLGFDVDDEGGIAENEDATPKQFALMWQLEGDKGGRRVVWYGCTSSIPTFTSATATDSMTEASETATITASPVDVIETVNNTQVSVKRTQWSCEKGHTLYNTFFTAIPHATME